MKPAARPPTGSGVGKTIWMLLCGFGVLVVAAGFSVPYLVLGQGGPLLDVPSPAEPAAPAPATEPPMAADWPTPRDLLLRLGGGTVVVLGLGVAILFLCRRWFQPRPAGVDEKREFELIETLHLGNRCCVHLVRAGGQHLLTGMDATGLKAVTALVDMEEELLGPGWSEEPGSLAGKMREWSAAAKAGSGSPRSGNG
jgi:flagellar biogenesis protein FliO